MVLKSRIFYIRPNTGPYDRTTYQKAVCLRPKPYTWQHCTLDGPNGNSRNDSECGFCHYAAPLPPHPLTQYRQQVENIHFCHSFLLSIMHFLLLVSFHHSFLPSVITFYRFPLHFSVTSVFLTWYPYVSDFKVMPRQKYRN